MTLLGLLILCAIHGVFASHGHCPHVHDHHSHQRHSPMRTLKQPLTTTITPTVSHVPIGGWPESQDATLRVGGNGKSYLQTSEEETVLVARLIHAAGGDASVGYIHG